MPDQSDILAQLSKALAARTAAARDAVTAIRISSTRHLTGTTWRSDLIVASEQSLPKRDKFDVVLPGGAGTEATLVGRDAGTNIALLRLAQPARETHASSATAEAGALVLAFGADGGGGATARMGLVNFIGPEWHSHAGDRIEARIALDMRMALAEEGGPVFTVEGARLGITTFGPRRRVLVIPANTIESVIPLMIAARPRGTRLARGGLSTGRHP